MAMNFSDRLYTRVQPLWDAYLEHPFIKGLGKGDLNEEKFKHYLTQGYIYLIEYSRIFAIGVSKARDLYSMTIFTNLLYSTMNYEMALLREYANKLGISNEELEATVPSATMTAYTSYMLNNAHSGGVENATVVALACSWSYNFIGQKLSQWPGALEHGLYGSWVQMYSSEGFTKIANDCKELLNEITKGKPENELKELEEMFIQTSNFEYMFWDMAENQLTWPFKVLT